MSAAFEAATKAGSIENVTQGIWPEICGGADGSRTRDLVPAEHALYQLSYSPGRTRFYQAPVDAL